MNCSLFFFEDCFFSYLEVCVCLYDFGKNWFEVNLIVCLGKCYLFAAAHQGLKVTGLDLVTGRDIVLALEDLPVSLEVTRVELQQIISLLLGFVA